MSIFNFILETGKIVKKGDVIRSEYATVGRYQPAIGTLEEYVVFDDVNKEMHITSGPYSAAKLWHEINYKNIRRLNGWT